jgi:3-oxoadipate enol-lactonase
LVLLNGLFADTTSYDNVVADYSAHFNVLRFDGRGQGKSPRPETDKGYLLEDQIGDMEGLFHELGLFNKDVYLVGLSNGGRLALEFAVRHPDTVKALVAADVYHKVSPLLEMKLSGWLKANAVGGPFHRFDIATPWIWGESVLRKRPDLVEIYRQRADHHSSEVVEALIKGAMAQYEIDLGNINCPTLLMVGREDLLTPVFNHQEMAEEIKQCQFEIIDGGHASLLESPNVHHQKIIPFLLEQQNV